MINARALGDAESGVTVRFLNTGDRVSKLRCRQQVTDSYLRCWQHDNGTGSFGNKQLERISGSTVTLRERLIPLTITSALLTGYDQITICCHRRAQSTITCVCRL